MPAQDDVKEGTDELMACCRQLLASDIDQEHSLSDGKKDPYKVGGLAIEMEGCPHIGCGARFFSSPVQNLQHQDSIHRAILAHVCATYWGIYILEGALIRYIIHGQDGPVGFENDMNNRHGERVHTKVSYMYLS